MNPPSQEVMRELADRLGLAWATPEAQHMAVETVGPVVAEAFLLMIVKSLPEEKQRDVEYLVSVGDSDVLVSYLLAEVPDILERFNAVFPRVGKS